MSLSKNSVLERASSYDILNYYLQPYHNHGKLTQGQNISNPFLGQKQDTPSFNIYCKLPEHEWMYKDFATEDKGSCIDLVMKLFNLPFKEALHKIVEDFNLTNSRPSPSKKGLATPQSNHKPSYSVKEKQYSQEELSFWAKYQIGHEVLLRYNVVSIDEYTGISKSNKEYKVKSSSNNFIFGYKNESWIKIYKPNGEKRFKFGHLGIKEPNFIFGLKQLPQTGDILFITGGEKDVMTLAAHGFNAISLNSETATLEKSIANELKHRFHKIIVLYDIDATGLKQSELLAVEHGFHKITLPEIPNNGKDISDYFYSKGSISDFEAMLTTSLQAPLPQAPNPDKVVFNAVELMAMGNLEPQYLITPILPRKGTAVLAGKPDTGKSQFARQLCIQVANGLKLFIGFEINPIHSRSIYVATEDNLENTRYLMSRQINGLNEGPKANLRFVFADTMEQEEILKELDNQLTIAEADLVVVDSFGDIFKGGDSNNNMAMRNTVKAFDRIANKHNCLILFVHHINKGAYRQTPGQEHIQGGAGLMQKVRLGIILSEGENNTRYFSVVKGNYCPKEYKENSIVLNFSEETFLFENNGSLILTSELGTQAREDRRDDKNNDLERIANDIFGDKIISFSTFKTKFCERTGGSDATAARKHKSLKEMGIIVEVNGGYRLSKLRVEDNSADYADEMPF